MKPASLTAQAADPLPAWNDGQARQSIEALKEAPQRGWMVVSMKDNWKTILTFETG